MRSFVVATLVCAYACSFEPATLKRQVPSEGDATVTADGGSGADAATGDDIVLGGDEVPGNRPPAVTVDAPGVVVPSGSASINIEAVDPEGDAVTFHADWFSHPSVSPPPLVVNATGTLTVPAPSAVHSVIIIEVWACDSYGACTEPPTLVVMVVDTDTNRAHGFVSASDGDDLFAGTALEPWRTIAYGITQLTSGGVLHVAAGTYPEALTLTDDLIVVGAHEPVTWKQNLGTGAVVISPVAQSAVRYASSSGATGAAELRRVTLSPSGTFPPGDIASTVGVLTGTLILTDVDIEIPRGDLASAGILVLGTDGALNALRVEIYGGSTEQSGGTLYGLSVAAGGEVDATALDIAPLPTERYSFYGIWAVSADVRLLASGVVIPNAPGLPPNGGDFSIAAAIDGGSFALSGGSLDAGAHHTVQMALRLTGAAVADLSAATLSGGSTPPSGVSEEILSVAAAVDTGSSLTAVDSYFVAGNTSIATATLAGIRCNGCSLSLTNTDVSTRFGGEGVGVDLTGAFDAVLTNSRVGRICQDAAACTGIRVDGDHIISADPDPTASLSSSCCDPTVFPLVVEGGRVWGGGSALSTAIHVRGTAGAPALCLNGVFLDGGLCPTGLCRGLAIDVASRAIVHNSTIFGGQGLKTRGAELQAGRIDFAHNYVHGGVGTDESMGVFLTPTTGALTVANNAIHSGTGPTGAPVWESDANADPGAFFGNNLWGHGTALYDNYDLSAAHTLLTTATSDWVGELTTNQNSVLVGDPLWNDSCFDDAQFWLSALSPQANTACVNAGVSSASCGDVCLLPWADASGKARLTTGWRMVDSLCTDFVMNGDGQPDIGPFEQ